ncbi:MAG: hypothetical protein CMI32_01075 [Opitutales bacterium]|nr:hypothetical protein [Opitutales bacterium]
MIGELLLSDDRAFGEVPVSEPEPGETEGVVPRRGAKGRDEKPPPGREEEGDRELLARSTEDPVPLGFNGVTRLNPREGGKTGVIFGLGGITPLPVVEDRGRGKERLVVCFLPLGFFPHCET